MPQTSYSTDLSPALAGMLADTGPHDIGRYPASEVIPVGRATVLNGDGTVSLPKGTGALPANGTGSFAGVSIYLSASPTGGYQIGDVVPVLRKGRIWTDFAGTGATDGEAMQICHASDDTNSELAHRGMFSDAAASTTAGQEKTTFDRCVARGGSSNTLALVDVNVP